MDGASRTYAAPVGRAALLVIVEQTKARRLSERTRVTAEIRHGNSTTARHTGFFGLRIGDTRNAEQQCCRVEKMEARKTVISRTTAADRTHPLHQ